MPLDDVLILAPLSPPLCSPHRPARRNTATQHALDSFSVGSVQVPWADVPGVARRLTEVPKGGMGMGGGAEGRVGAGGAG